MRFGLRGNRDYAEVDLWREAAIQANFLFAIMFAFLERTEIEEAEIDGLLELVSKRPREKDDRDVRLMHLDSLRRVRVRLGTRQRFDQRFHFDCAISRQNLIRLSGATPVLNIEPSCASGRKPLVPTLRRGNEESHFCFQIWTSASTSLCGGSRSVFQWYNGQKASQVPVKFDIPLRIGDA